MDDKHAMWLRAVDTLLVELFDGPPSEMAFILNVGDMGLLRQLESLDAKTASTRPMPGQTTIAAHVDHVLYGITLLNRAADGEPNPWATADWEASWRRTTVDDAEWRILVARLRTAAEAWKRNAQTWSQWDDITAPGVLSSVAHTAYHIGAIRQILAAAGQNHAPR
ncbi:MAG: hypothetical protein JWM57_2510 [Phycisphaerales bacterium]|nr:hypothetical protein [Phycisphaerales bacterium]